MKKSIPLFLIFAILVLCFFGSAGSPLAQEAKIKQQNGVTIISNPKDPQPENGIPIRLVFTEELSIGVEEGAEEFMFGKRLNFITDDQGNFYVNDWDRKEIRKYDNEGNFLLIIGGPGQGPGEFRNPWGPTFTPDGNIFVMDIAANRLSLFETNGRFLHQTKIPEGISVHHIHSNGLYFLNESKILQDTEVSKFAVSYGLYDAEFHPVAEIYQRIHENKHDTRSRTHYLAKILSDAAFQPTTTFLVTEEDLIYFGYSDKYEIRIFSPEGMLIEIIQRDYEPVEVTKKHKQDYIRVQKDEVLRFLREQDKPLIKEIIKLVKYPKHKPAFQKFIRMENGWLAVVVDYSEGEALFDLFDEEGKYIAQFKASIPIANLFFKNGKAYALAIENDYRYVKRYAFKIQEKKNNNSVILSRAQFNPLS
jgi:hypothetical protein